MLGRMPTFQSCCYEDTKDRYGQNLLCSHGAFKPGMATVAGAHQLGTLLYTNF